MLRTHLHLPPSHRSCNVPAAIDDMPAPVPASPPMHMAQPTTIRSLDRLDVRVGPRLAGFRKRPDLDRYMIGRHRLPDRRFCPLPMAICQCHWRGGPFVWSSALHEDHGPARDHSAHRELVIGGTHQTRQEPVTGPSACSTDRGTCGVTSQSRARARCGSEGIAWDRSSMPANMPVCPTSPSGADRSVWSSLNNMQPSRRRLPSSSFERAVTPSPIPELAKTAVVP